MVTSAEELGWIILVGFAAAFAAELALSAYVSRGRAKRPETPLCEKVPGFKDPTAPTFETIAGSASGC
jgi:hypothetical protein